jgi:hypothetical protein
LSSRDFRPCSWRASGKAVIDSWLGVPSSFSAGVTAPAGWDSLNKEVLIAHRRILLLVLVGRRENNKKHPDHE